MNQNKSNVPVSVAEEPDELSYYRLTLLSFLRESHPDLADDESFVATRSEQAADALVDAEHGCANLREAVARWQAVRSGLTYDDAAQQANALLFQGLHFSPLDTLVTVLWNEFAAEVPEGSARSVALQLLPECRKVFAGYTLSDDFMFSPEFGQLYDELTGTVVIWLEENGL